MTKRRPVTAVVYLHGFISSPDSAKAIRSRQWFAQHFPALPFYIPALPPYPDAAVGVIRACLQELADAQGSDCEPGLVGSSLGGFYANQFAEQTGCRAVLVNPAVYPHRLLAGRMGEQHNPYTGERFRLELRHMQALQNLLVENMKNPALRMVLLQTGDETLDYREAGRYFAHSDLHVEWGGDHSFTGFERWLPKIAGFFGLTDLRNA